MISKNTVRVRAKKSQTFIDLTPECKAIQDQIMDRIKANCYKAYPLIEPPLPWLLEPGEARDNTSGGYHTEFIRDQLPLGGEIPSLSLDRSPSTS